MIIKRLTKIIKQYYISNRFHKHRKWLARLSNGHKNTSYPTFHLFLKAVNNKSKQKS